MFAYTFKLWSWWSKVILDYGLETGYETWSGTRFKQVVGVGRARSSFWSKIASKPAAFGVVGVGVVSSSSSRSSEKDPIWTHSRGQTCRTWPTHLAVHVETVPRKTSKTSFSKDCTHRALTPRIEGIHRGLFWVRKGWKCRLFFRGVASTVAYSNSILSSSVMCLIQISWTFQCFMAPARHNFDSTRANLARGWHPRLGLLGHRTWEVYHRLWKYQINNQKSLVGGFNPFEKYSSNWIISPGRAQVGVKMKNIWNHHLKVELSRLLHFPNTNLDRLGHR